MSSTAASFADTGVHPQDRLVALFDELSELAGQRNAIDGRIVDIAAQMDRERLWGATGARSVAELMAWKLGTSSTNAQAITAIANRLETFPRCVGALREGRLSLDQVGVIAARAGDGSDEHYFQLATYASVSQLRTAVKLEPRPKPRPDPDPDPDADADPESDADPGSDADADADVDADAVPVPRPEPERWFAKSEEDEYTTYRIRLPRLEAATFDAALASHRDGLIVDWEHHHQTGDGVSAATPRFPTNVDAFMSLVEAGWDSAVAARPHGQRTTAVMHVDVKDRLAALHLGPLLSDDERRFLLCDATCEVWFERHGRVIGSGRATRTVSRRLRRALEHRDHTCVVPGCGATRGLHAHHLRHWEDGGLTELDNLALVCPYHHRCHHRGVITITGPVSADMKNCPLADMKVPTRGQ